MMIDENMTLYSVSTLLERNKSINYKNSIIKTSTSLLRFFHDNNLLIDLIPFDDDGELKRDAVIRKKNLTTEGYEMFKKRIVDEWLMKLDRSISPSKYDNIRHLEKGLEKILKNRLPQKMLNA